MENFGLWIYLISLSTGIRIFCGVILFICFCVIWLSFMKLEFSNIKDSERTKCNKSIHKYIIIAIIFGLITVLIPSKKTCYQIAGITAAVEIYQNSESLQQLPEKSISALNRLLDSIAPEDNKE